MIRPFVVCLLVSFGAVLASSSRAQEQQPYRAAIDAIYPVMIQALEAGNFTQARNICDQAIVWDPTNPVHHYNLACIETRAGPSRKTQALAALRHCATLGFAAVDALQQDPDLAGIRADPEFAKILRLVALNVVANASVTVPSPASEPPPSPRGMENVALLTPGDPPAPASFKEGVPVGLFFMTRFWSFTGTLEKVVWYFAPDGSVFQGLENGFSLRDLAAHTGPKGQGSLNGDKLEIRWADGKKSSSHLSRSDSGFSWDAGIFTVVKPFDPKVPEAGVYEGGESLSVSGNRAAVSKTLELRPDGTYRWSGVSFISNTTDAGQVTAGANGDDSTGRWHASGYTLVLVDSKGHVYRRIAFPYDDDKTPVNPDRIFVGGTMFKRQDNK
ncbi:MAG: hypothetical protein V4773_00670 [Verrucomicrobiota bacterium]